MGGVESQPVSSSEQLAVAKGNSRSEFLRQLAQEHREAEAQDFYEMFSLKRYVEMDEEVERSLKRKFYDLALRWHPDKNPASQKKTCEVWMAKIVLAKSVLTDPDLKRRYDIELREQRDEEDGWSTTHESPIVQRLQKLAPDVVHLLVDDPVKADFMLSRTNQQKDFADKKVAALLREGFTLCADNSLAGGWGGAGWCRRYVEDSKRTRFGILVVEGGESFFRSGPCCDELYGAHKAGINMTKVHGSSIKGGEYLWVKITEQIFESHREYEATMRQKHGDQFTPTHFTATLTGHYDRAMSGTRYTYYCVVPDGRAAKATGADQQRFPK